MMLDYIFVSKLTNLQNNNFITIIFNSIFFFKYYQLTKESEMTINIYNK